MLNRGQGGHEFGRRNSDMAGFSGLNFDSEADLSAEASAQARIVQKGAFFKSFAIILGPRSNIFFFSCCYLSNNLKKAFLPFNNRWSELTGCLF